MLGFLIGAAIAGGGSFYGFIKTRQFVRERLRFVDAAHKPATPLVAGAIAALAASPLALLPFIGIPTAVLFGVGIAAGVSAGSRDARSLPSG